MNKSRRPLRVRLVGFMSSAWNHIIGIDRQGLRQRAQPSLSDNPNRLCVSPSKPPQDKGEKTHNNGLDAAIYNRAVYVSEITDAPTVEDVEAVKAGCMPMPEVWWKLQDYVDRRKAMGDQPATPEMLEELRILEDLADNSIRLLTKVCQDQTP